MIDLYKNDQLYNIVAEGEISGILAHYNSDYIMSIIQDNIKILTFQDIPLLTHQI